MKSPRRSGMTLMEVVVVMSVVGLIAYMLVGLVGNMIEASQISRAKKDINAIVQALYRFKEDMGGRWPRMNASGTWDRVGTLMTGDTTHDSQPYGFNIQTSNNQSWVRAAWGNDNYIDRLDNHLVLNTPYDQSSNTYPTSGKHHWKGPYMELSKLDPWGQPYMVYFYRSMGEFQVFRPYASFVYSAGPNGYVDSSFLSPDLKTFSGDDIAVSFDDNLTTD